MKDQQIINEKFKERTTTLNKIFILQRSPKNKTGLGYDHEHAIKGSISIIQDDVENFKCWDDAPIDTPMQQNKSKKTNTSHRNYVHPLKMRKFKRYANEKSHYK